MIAKRLLGLCIIVVVTFLFAVDAEATAAPAKGACSIIPAPLSMTPQKGQFRLRKQTPIFYLGGQTAEVARYLADFLQTATGYTLAVKPLNSSRKVTGILLRVVPTEADLGPEGYRLMVSV